ncbi:MAG: hypothetical protein Q9159_005605, partial [Coniocarpon cinnabarinum]
MVDGLLQSLNGLPDAFGPAPALDPVQTDFPNGRFRPSSSTWDLRRLRARSTHGGSISSGTQIGHSEEPTSSPSSRSRRPQLFHRRRHTSSSSQGTISHIATQKASDVERREAAKKKTKTPATPATQERLPLAQ